MEDFTTLGHHCVGIPRARGSFDCVAKASFKPTSKHRRESENGITEIDFKAVPRLLVQVNDFERNLVSLALESKLKTKWIVRSVWLSGQSQGRSDISDLQISEPTLPR